jgi:hypothetical protein
MKKEYNIKDKVWIHIGEAKLVEGRVVEIIDLEHLDEGHRKEDELYVIELKTGIEDIYEVRTFGMISPDAKGPINVFRDMSREVSRGNRFMKKIGMPIPNITPNPLEEFVKEINEELDSEPTPDQIHAAMEASQVRTTIPPFNALQKPPGKKRPYYKKKKTNA